MAKIIDGKTIAANVKKDLKRIISSSCTRAPRLGIITIGGDDASKVYVKNKLKAAEEVGITAVQYKFTIDDYMNNRFVFQINAAIAANDGIILQLPVPEWCDAKEILNLIPPHKDVDGLTSAQIGYLRENITSNPTFEPCTPAGIITLLETIGYSAGANKNALIIGRSNLVGRPMAELLLKHNYTVSIAHSKTSKSELCRLFSNADVVIAATGTRNLLTLDDAEQYWKDNRFDFYADFTNKHNRAIIDVGMNRDNQGKLCGDLSEEFKQQYSAYYTPVPGGVGPMTVCMLMNNTYQAFLNKKE